MVQTEWFRSPFLQSNLTRLPWSMGRQLFTAPFETITQLPRNRQRFLRRSNPRLPARRTLKNGIIFRDRRSLFDTVRRNMNLKMIHRPLHQLQILFVICHGLDYPIFSSLRTQPRKKIFPALIGEKTGKMAKRGKDAFSPSVFSWPPLSPAVQRSPFGWPGLLRCLGAQSAQEAIPFLVPKFHLGTQLSAQLRCFFPWSRRKPCGVQISPVVVRNPPSSR